jgi:hypothetical protein
MRRSADGSCGVVVVPVVVGEPCVLVVVLPCPEVDAPEDPVAADEPVPVVTSGPPGFTPEPLVVEPDELPDPVVDGELPELYFKGLK